MNSLITAAVSSGTSSVGKWLTASKRRTEYQGWSRATDSCAEWNSGTRGCAYTWSTGTGGLKVLNAWSGSPSRANIAEISRPPGPHLKTVSSGFIPDLRRYRGGGDADPRGD